MSDAHIDSALRLLESAFGYSLDRDWYAWKHQSGPWGPSPGWVAIDENGVVGVRLFLRWRLDSGLVTLNALRPCDTVTAPRARGRGVFRALTEGAIAETETSCDLFYNTPNEQSLPGYLKMGFEEWTQVPQRLGWVTPRTATLSDRADPPLELGNDLRTAVSQAFIDWRYGSCPRYSYDAADLVSAESRCGSVYRVRSWHGLKIVVFAELWGDHIDRRALISAVAAKEGTPLVWITEDHRSATPVSLARKPTVVTFRHRLSGDLQRPNFSLGDIEDVL